MRSPAFEIAVLDLGGTTVYIGDVVERVVREVTGDQFDPAQFKALRGGSKLDLMTRLVGPDRASSAHAAFERGIEAALESGEFTPMPGAGEAMAQIDSLGIKICLLTGFSVSVQRAIVERFGWEGTVALALSPTQELRGRPWPDLILTAATRLHASDVESVAVVGDTANDVEAARRAGAGLCVGVLTGAHDRATLQRANPTHIVDDLAGFVDLLG